MTSKQIQSFGKAFAAIFKKAPYKAWAKELEISQFSCGACLMVVKALKRAFGEAGEVWVVAEYDGQSGDWPLDHFILKVGDWFIDSDGVFTEEQALERIRSCSMNPKFKIAPRRGFKNLWTGESEMPYDPKIVKKMVEDAEAILSKIAA